MKETIVIMEFSMWHLERRPISHGKMSAMIRDKVEHCCRRSPVKDVIGIAESLDSGGSSADLSGGLQ